MLILFFGASVSRSAKMNKLDKIKGCIMASWMVVLCGQCRDLFVCIFETFFFLSEFLCQPWERTLQNFYFRECNWPEAPAAVLWNPWLIVHWGPQLPTHFNRVWRGNYSTLLPGRHGIPLLTNLAQELPGCFAELSLQCTAVRTRTFSPY